MKILLLCICVWIVNFNHLSGEDWCKICDQQIESCLELDQYLLEDRDWDIEVVACSDFQCAKSKSVDQDLEIVNLFTEQTFTKLSIDYVWRGKTYLVHFVYNPEKEVIFSSELSKPVQWPFAMTISASTYPSSLVDHLKNLVPSKLLKDSESLIDVADRTFFYTREHPDSVYTSLYPITMLSQIENPDVDAEIVSLFQSDRLETKTVYYELDGEFYAVLLIHNPKKLKLKSNGSFESRENGRINYIYTWKSKVGVFVDKKAPQKLIDHISGLYNLSWWDSYWNLTIYNGNKVLVEYQKGNWNYTYTPCSVFSCMLKAKP